MALKVYDTNRLSVADLAGRIVTSHNGSLGEAVDVLLYLRNADPNVYYNGISVQVQDSYASNDTLGPAGSGWGTKLSPGSRRPTVDEWDIVPYGNIISIKPIGTTVQADTVTYYPFWLRVVVPGNEISQVKDEMTLVVSAGERLIGT